MNLYRVAASLILALFLCAPASAQEDGTASRKQKAVTAEKAPPVSGREVPAAVSTPEKAKDALDALPEWEKRYVKETRITIENNVEGIMVGILSRKDLATSIDTFIRTWDKWTESKLFIMNDGRDIDVYGNLYSLQVMCRTLLLAANDWRDAEPSIESQQALEKAEWLEKRSRRLAEPVAEIVRNQSYSSYLPRRIEIMQDMLPYVDICYRERGYSKRLQ